ncbi:nucleolar protein 10-like [Haematobia irritans]|uniref:nucleolar protein 10-like n=1 Tax=Haematobia irritans TaxID=7368 RepID=UPI003F4F6DF8
MVTLLILACMRPRQLGIPSHLIVSARRKYTKKSKVNVNLAYNLTVNSHFKAIFENTDFNIDKNAEEYKLLAPVLNRLEKSKLKETKKHE